MLTDQQRRLCRLFSCVVLGDWDEVRRIRRDAPPGEPDRAWREALLMVHLFAGVPRNIEAFDHLADAGGVGTPGPEELLGPESDVEAGARLFDVIYGGRADAVRTHLEGHHADFAGWVADHAYGRVLCRPGLDPATREFLAVAALASLGQERQLAGHARGAVRCGAPPEAVRAVLGALSEAVPEERRRRAKELVERFARPDKPQRR